MVEAVAQQELRIAAVALGAEDEEIRLGGTQRCGTGAGNRQAIAAALQESDLRPIDQVVELPRPPVAEFVISVVLLVLAVLVAIIGLGTPTTSANIPPRTITVAGADPSAGKVIKVDLSKPIVVAET